jgi:hypothetical protein
LIDNNPLTSYFAFDFKVQRRLDLTDPNKSRKGRKVFWALALIAIGVMILLHNLGYIRGDILRYWPVIVILLGLKKLLD